MRHQPHAHPAISCQPPAMPPATQHPAACSRLLPDCLCCALQESKHNDQLQPSARPRNALHSQRLGAPVTRPALLVERHGGRSRRRTRSAAAVPVRCRWGLECSREPPATAACTSSVARASGLFIAVSAHSVPPPSAHRRLSGRLAAMGLRRRQTPRSVRTLPTTSR